MNAIPGAPLFWSAEQVTIATVSPLGVVTALTPGSTRVAVSARGQAMVVPVLVTGHPVTLVRVSPAAATVRAGSTVRLVAEGYRSDGKEEVGTAFAWTSSHPAIASVSNEAVVTAVLPGSVTISAAPRSVMQRPWVPRYQSGSRRCSCVS